MGQKSFELHFNEMNVVDSRMKGNEMFDFPRLVSQVIKPKTSAVSNSALNWDQ